MKDTPVEIRNNLQGNNSRVDEAKNQISNLEYKETKKQPIRTARRKKESKNNEDSASSLWDNLESSNICIVEVPEEKRKSKKLEIYF